VNPSAIARVMPSAAFVNHVLVYEANDDEETALLMPYSLDEFEKEINGIKPEDMGLVAELYDGLSILADSTRQLEKTPGDYFIFRLTPEDIVKVAQALKYAQEFLGHPVEPFGFAGGVMVYAGIEPKGTDENAR